MIRTFLMLDRVDSTWIRSDLGENFWKFLQNSKGNGGALLKVTFQLYTRKKSRDLRGCSRKFMVTSRRVWSQILGFITWATLREWSRRHISQIVVRLTCELSFKNLRDDFAVPTRRIRSDWHASYFQHFASAYSQFMFAVYLANVRVNFKETASIISQYLLANYPQIYLRVNFGKSARSDSQNMFAASFYQDLRVGSRETASTYSQF